MMNKYVKILKAIKEIHKTEVFMPSDLCSYVNKITGEMFNCIRIVNNNGDDEVRQIKNAI